MRDRRGVVVLCFDMPVKTNKNKKDYREFKKKLKTHGFQQMQKSIYVLLVHNLENADDDIAKIKSYSPQNSNIVTFMLSLSNFMKMSTISGKPFDMSTFSDNIVYV